MRLLEIHTRHDMLPAALIVSLVDEGRLTEETLDRVVSEGLGGAVSNLARSAWRTGADKVGKIERSQTPWKTAADELGVSAAARGGKRIASGVWNAATGNQHHGQMGGSRRSRDYGDPEWQQRVHAVYKELIKVLDMGKPDAQIKAMRDIGTALRSHFNSL